MNLIREQRRKTVRAPVNPMDKSTIFSIYNKPFREIKPTIQPGIFEMPAGTVEQPARLVVEPSSWWREIDPEQPLLEIPVSSIVIAESVVKDYISGLVGYNSGGAYPGLFYVPGDINVIKLKTEFKKTLDTAIERQKNWYRELIHIADIGWARSGGNPITINDDMRMAARELNMINKDWMVESQQVEQVRCVACGQLRSPNYPICQHCKAIVDPEKAKELGLKFAV